MKTVSPEIKSMTIDVKVIKIGNSKMTLSVFSQLYEESPIVENQIKYPIWGKVKKEDIEWVVWQKNTDLRKYKLPYINDFLTRIEFVSALIMANDDSFFEKIRSKHGLKDYFFHETGLRKSYNAIAPKDWVTAIKNNEDVYSWLIDKYNYEYNKYEARMAPYRQLKNSDQLFISI